MLIFCPSCNPNPSEVLLIFLNSFLSFLQTEKKEYSYLKLENLRKKQAWWHKIELLFFKYDQTTHVKVVICNFFLGLKMSFGNLQINLKIKKIVGYTLFTKKKSQNEENVAVKIFKSAENQMS